MPISFNNGGVYEVTLVGEYDGAIETNLVHHLQLVSGGPLDEAFGLDDIEGWLDDIIQILIVLQAAIQIWKGYRVTALEGNQTTGFVPIVPIGGANLSPALPSGTAALVYMNTGESRRQLRKYVPGLGEDRTGADGEFGAGVGTQLALLATPYLSNYVGPNGTWAYGHYRTGVPGSFVRPTSLAVQTVVSYQRRRRRGRGI